ncbi:hypothetical protein J7K50_10115 [bacterium]|nr:hypothetical protein [bacterium]
MGKRKRASSDEDKGVHSGDSSLKTHDSHKAEEDEARDLGEPPKSRLSFYLMLVIFVIVSVVVVVYAGRSQRTLNEEFQTAMLPAGMPRVIPFPKTIVEIDMAKNLIEDYTYTIQGGDEPAVLHTGKKYTIEGSSDKTPDEIRDFYNDLLLDKGFRQRVNISLPTGHRLDLESDENIVSIEVERKSSDLRTSVKIVVFD